MKIIYFTDPHAKGRNPASRVDDYTAAIHAKILEIEDVCLFEEPEALVIGGDLWDIPKVSNSLVIWMMRVLRRIKKRGTKIFLVPGNHDEIGYTLSTLDQTSIGLLYDSGIVSPLYRGHSYLLKDKKGLTVEIFGREFDKDIDADPSTDYEIQPQHQATWNLLFSHGMLLQKPFHPDVKFTLTKDVVSQAHLIANGHYHPGYPIHEENNIIFMNPGSTGRDEASANTMTRTPQYAIIDINKKRIKPKYIQYDCAKPSKDIFDQVMIANEKEYERYLESFEQTIVDAMTYDAFDPKDVLAELAKVAAIPADVIQAALDAMIAVEFNDKKVNKLDGYIEKKRPIAISEVEITNFESHEKTVVKFNEYGVNAITGPSDSGKTGLIRALRWVFYNDPKGSDFVRHGASRATAKVTFSDGSSILRSRTNSDAGEYIVTDAGGREQVFKGFGNTVPIEVANTHQMPKVQLAPDLERPLNFAYQLDGHFLLSQSPGVRAAVIGRLTGTNIVDEAIKRERAKLLNVAKECNLAEAKVKEYDEKLTAYADLPEEQQQVAAAEGILMALDGLLKERQELESINDDLEDVKHAKARLQEELKAFGKLDLMEKLLLQADKQLWELNELMELRKARKESRAAIERITTELQHYARLDLVEAKLAQVEQQIKELNELEQIAMEIAVAEGDLIRLNKEYAAYTKLDQMPSLDTVGAKIVELKDLERIQVEISAMEMEAGLLDDKIKGASKEIEDVEKEIRALFAANGNKCPTCFATVDDEHLEHIIAAV